MMEKDIIFEKLSAYLDGELTLDEKDNFEKEIALSSDLQKKLAELRKLKQLTASSLKPLSESPYFETRLFASLKEHKFSFFLVKRLSPIAGFLVLALVLMIFLKYNPQLIQNLVEQQKSNLTGLYKQNLKPLLFAANLTNEDVFNFAFNHQLPLDKTNSQYLQLGYDTIGNGYFEIKTGNVASNVNNLNKFIRALNLNPQQKEKVDSILQNYAEDLQSQVLVNDKNTVALNPNIWNYNKAVLADIIAFANNANKEGFSKICPVGLTSYDKNSIVKAINEVKKTRDNQYIFFTPDTIFSENYDFDKGKFKDEMRKMKEEMKKASYDWKKFAINLQLDSSIIKLKHDPSWGKNFKVQFDENTCRVNLQNLVPGIELPDFDSITVQIERAADMVNHITVNIPRMTINIPEGTQGKNVFNFKMNVPGHPGKIAETRVDLDSIMRQNKYFSQKFFGQGKRGQLNLDSLLANIRSMFPDSMSNFNSEEYKSQLKEFQKEMKKFQQQMKEMEKELKKNKRDLNEKNDPIEI
jgi:DNA-binding protein YbaB